MIRELEPYAGRPVLYTGAFENHPEVLRSIEARHSILGNDADTVLAVRDPQRTLEVLRRFRIPHLGVRPSADAPRADGSWLLKPLHGSAGRGVTIWDEQATGSPTCDEPHYYQRRGTGETCSAVFLAQQDPFQCRYVGLTRQLVGTCALNAPPFRWCGSIGPLVLDTETEILIRRTGIVLAQHFGLRGLFGCDFVVESPSRPLLTEINPRYTGSVEVIEALAGLNLVMEHCLASGYDGPDVSANGATATGRLPIVGKVVVYSDRELTVPDTSQWMCTTPWQTIPGYADVPREGTVIPAGGPICSILGEAETTEVCLDSLLHCGAEVLRALSAADSSA